MFCITIDVLFISFVKKKNFKSVYCGFLCKNIQKGGKYEKNIYYNTADVYCGSCFWSC